MLKRKREKECVEEQTYNKKTKIQKQMIDGIINYDKKELHSIKINNVFLTAKVKEYDVNITQVDGKIKFLCSCTGDVYTNFNNSYCKHIALSIKELIKEYLKENEKFFRDKAVYELFKENIEFLTMNIQNINIKNESTFPQ